MIGEVSRQTLQLNVFDFYRTWGPIYGSGCLLLSICSDLTDVTLADKDTNSILTYNANRAIQDYVVMQVCN